MNRDLASKRFRRCSTGNRIIVLIGWWIHRLVFGCHSSAQSFFAQRISAEDFILEAGQGFAGLRLAAQNVFGGVFSFGFGAWKLEGLLLKSPRRLVPRSFAEVRVLTQIVSCSPPGYLWIAPSGSLTSTSTTRGEEYGTDGGVSGFIVPEMGRR